MPRTKSSQRWLKEHFADPFVKRAQKEGYRSRAVYKLLALHERNRLFYPGMIIVDLGAAPGGWSQVATQLIGKSGKVYALDILPMAAIAGVEFMLGDFSREIVVQAFLQKIANHPVDLVMSDIAPNLSGNAAIDQPRVMYLAELALDFAQQILCSEGSFLVKLFQGVGFDAYLSNLRKYFKQVSIRKPDASRARSAEIYLLAKGFLK